MALGRLILVESLVLREMAPPGRMAAGPAVAEDKVIVSEGDGAGKGEGLGVVDDIEVVARLSGRFSEQF